MPTSKPTVAHVSTVHRWDDARITRRQIPSLCAAGYDVLWVVPTSTDARIDLSGPARLERLPMQGMWRRFLGMPALVKRLTALNADIYHLHDPELLLIADALSRRTNATVIYDKHEYQRGRRGVKAAVIRALERTAIPLLDGLILVDYADPANPHVRAAPDLDDIAPPQVEVAVVPNYPHAQPDETDDNRVGGARISQSGNDGLRLVYTGVVAGERGLWMMLDVLESLRRSGRKATLVLAGICFRQAERDEFERALRHRNLEDAVERLGWTRYATSSEVADAIASGDAGFMLMDPAYRSWSNIPSKFYEYMAAGLPYVCTNYPEWRKFVQGRGGVVVDPRDAGAVADVVCTIVDNASVRRELSESGQRASASFSWTHSSFALRELYAQLRSKHMPGL